MSREASLKAHESMMRQSQNGFGELGSMYRRAFAQRRDDKRRRVQFSLTEDEYVELVAGSAGRCKLSGLEFSAERYFAQGKVPFPLKPSLDRICASGGYTVDNVQLVCQIANFCKNEWTNDLVVMFCRAVAANTAVFYIAPQPLKCDQKSDAGPLQ